MNKNKREKIKAVMLLIIFIILLISVTFILNKIESEPEISQKSLENLESNLKKEISVINENEVENQFSNNVKNENSTVDNIVNEDIKVIEVTEENFEEEVLKSDKIVLIDFYADWCGPCKILSPIVEEVAKENTNIKVVKVDVDSNEKLAYEYKTYSIPTLVVIERGEEVNRAVGAIPKDDILDLIK